MRPQGSANEGIVETISCNRSSFETVGPILGQARKMKQNHTRFCFRAWSFSIVEVTVSRFGPEILGRL
jgi:hypothetical protein